MENNIIIISLYDYRYPKILKRIDDPPFLLHMKGNIDLLQKEAVAIIGTRKPCEYSINSTGNITRKLVNDGFCIVSGLAEGIDTVAHETALDSNGNTIAVLAHGLNMIYPEKNINLANRIVEKNGLLLSEYYFGKTYNKGFFISRDRIQSGLSAAVYVMESTINGGTMKTAEFSLKQNKRLFVLEPPGSLKNHSRYYGNIYLLGKNGKPIDNNTSKKERQYEDKKHGQQKLYDF